MTSIADILKSKLPIVQHKLSLESRNKEEVYTKTALESVLKVIQKKKEIKENKNG